MDLIFDAVLIFIIFFLICLLGQFLRFVDNRRDKRNLLKLKKECPEAKVYVNGRVSKCVKMVHLTCDVDGETKVIDCVKADIKDENPSHIDVYINNDEISFYKLKNAEKKSVRVMKASEYFGISVELDTREVVVEGNAEMKRKEKVRLSKVVTNEHFEIAGDELGDIDPEITHLVVHEPEIMEYEDSFTPNIFIDAVCAAGITAFILIGIAFVFKFNGG